MLVAAAKSRQSCPTLCDPIDSNLPGSAIPGILQARVLEWVAIVFSVQCWYTCMYPLIFRLFSPYRLDSFSHYRPLQNIEKSSLC